MTIRERTQTLVLDCPPCGSDAADTLGVTGGAGLSPDAAVVMRCDDCSTVYLSPVPAGCSSRRPPSAASERSRRLVLRWTRGLPSSTRILCVDRGAGEELVGLAGPFDLVFMPHALESADDPRALLNQVAGLLATNGRIVAVGGNPASCSFAMFGGRHWSGYECPGSRQFLSLQAMRSLGDDAGLRVARSRTLFEPGAWRNSLANWLRDWQAGNGMVRLFTGAWLLPWLLAGAAEGIAVLAGRGSLLAVQWERR